MFLKVTPSLEAPDRHNRTLVLSNCKVRGSRRVSPATSVSGLKQLLLIIKRPGASPACIQRPPDSTSLSGGRLFNALINCYEVINYCLWHCTFYNTYAPSYESAFYFPLLTMLLLYMLPASPAWSWVGFLLSQISVSSVLQL